MKKPDTTDQNRDYGGDCERTTVPDAPLVLMVSVRLRRLAKEPLIHDRCEIGCVQRVCEQNEMIPTDRHRKRRSAGTTSSRSGTGGAPIMLKEARAKREVIGIARPAAHFRNVLLMRGDIIAPAQKNKVILEKAWLAMWLDRPDAAGVSSATPSIMYEAGSRLSTPTVPSGCPCSGNDGADDNGEETNRLSGAPDSARALNRRET